MMMPCKVVNAKTNVCAVGLVTSLTETSNMSLACLLFTKLADLVFPS